MSTWTGTVPTFAAGDTSTVPTNLNVLRDVLKALTDSWTSYTPTWTASGTNPVLGNGSFAGSAYLQAGKLVVGRLVLTIGSTTTYGTGTWSLTLPVSAAASVARTSFTGIARDVSAGTDFPLVGQVTGSSSSLIVRQFPTTAGNQLVVVTNTSPIAWATGDIVTFDFSYEAA